MTNHKLSEGLSPDWLMDILNSAITHALYANDGKMEKAMDYMLVSEAHAAITAKIAEAVGEDDDHTYMQQPDKATDPVRTRNQLRAAIRKSLGVGRE